MLVLSAIWGASFLFIRVADYTIPPTGVVFGRLVLASVAVTAYAIAMRRTAGLSEAMRRPVVILIGVVNAAFPFLCYAIAETRVTSAIAGIANATTPLFGAVVAHLWPKDRGGESLTARRAIGLLVGFAGVVTLVASTGMSGNVDALGLALVLVAPACYAFGSLLSRSAFAHTSPLVPAATTTAWGAVVLIPLAGLTGRPAGMVSLASVASLLALGILGTGVAYIISFRLLANVGAPAMLTVTLIMPVFAVLYGHVLLGEPVPPTAVIALILILGGVAFGNRAPGSSRPSL